MTISDRALNAFREAGAVSLADAISSLNNFSGLPADQLTFPSDESFLTDIGVSRLTTQEGESSTTGRVELLIATEIVFGLPGLDGVSLVTGSGEGGVPQLVLELEIGPDVFEFRATGQAALRFDRGLLKPVEETASGWQEVPGKACEIALNTTLK